MVQAAAERATTHDSRPSKFLQRLKAGKVGALVVLKTELESISVGGYLE
jgi:hypothetical protein